MEMSLINPAIGQLTSIAKDPINNISLSYKFEVKKALLITAIALAVLSVTVWKETNISRGIFLLGTAGIVKAVWPKRVADVQPVVKMLTELYEEKKQSLRNQVRGAEVKNFQAAFKFVEQADFQYEKAKQSEKDYADIVHASEAIVDWDDNIALEKLHPVAQSAWKQVQQAVEKFLYGDTIFIGEARTNKLGQNLYIPYGFKAGKITVD